MKKHIVFILILFISVLGSFAQDYTFSSKNKKALKYYKLAEDAYILKDNPTAIINLEKSVRADKNFLEAWLLLGDAYTENNQLNSALEAYEKAISIDPDFFPRVYFFIGNLKFKTGKYSEAVSAYRKYKSLLEKNSAGEARVNVAIERALFAKESMDNPTPFIPVNAGELVNSANDEYVNYISSSNDLLMLTRKDLEFVDEMGRNIYIEHLFESHKVDGSWGKPDSLNIDWDEGLSLGGMNISVDGRKMYFTACNLPGGYGNCDLYFSFRQGRKWRSPMNMGTQINSQWWDSQPMVSSDGNHMFFASRRAGTKGGSDIWMSVRLSSGKWSPPVNLGDSINTVGNEMAPFLHADGKTLYFSSNGHKGFGGSDIYISRKDETGRWSKAKNLGYPINTFENEINFIVSLDGSEGWFSSDRAGGLGKVDIYSFKIGDPIAPQKVVFIKGLVREKLTREPLHALVELTDNSTGKLLDTVFSDKVTGEFLLVLQPGINYAFNISKKGYVFYSENFNLEDTIKDLAIEKEFLLSPIEIGATLVLENVFFDFDQSKLKAESYPELDRLFKVLISNPSFKIKISGHTDNAGTKDYNLELSESRARSVNDYLLGKGIDQQRLEYEGFGDSMPVMTNDSEEGRAKNRRTEITILD